MVGAVVSMVTGMPMPEEVLIRWLPSLRGGSLTLQVPWSLALVVAFWAPSTRTDTVLPGDATPDTVGWVSLVGTPMTLSPLPLRTAVIMLGELLLLAAVWP